MIIRPGEVEPELDDTLKQALDILRHTTERDPISTVHNRQIFIEQVRSLRNSRTRQPAFIWSQLFQRRRIRLAFKPAFALLIAVTILLGSAGTLAYAALDDLPGEPLYTMKLVGEDVTLVLALSDAAKMEQILAMTQNRVNEAVALAINGNATPEPLLNRLYTHLDYALRLASGMNDENLQQAMEIIHTRTEAQIRELNRTNLTGNGVMLQIHQRLQEQLRLAELGLDDPLKFRQQTQLGTRHQTEGQPGDSNPDATSQGPAASGEQPGLQDPQGTPGPQGPQGPQNMNAPDDNPGPQGPQEPNGVPEPQVLEGPLTTDGPEGQHGPQGPYSSQTDSPGEDKQDTPTPTPTATEQVLGLYCKSQNGNSLARAKGRNN